LENAALDVLGVNANYTTEIEPTPPSADNPYCKALAKVETRRFEDQLTQFWRTTEGSFVQISRGFDTPKVARDYFNDLKGADFVRCQKFVYTSVSRPELRFKFKQREIRFPDESEVFGVRESSYLAVGGELTSTFEATGDVMRSWNLAGALMQGSTVRLYFLSSSMPTAWEEFEDAAATLIGSDVAAEGAD
jgi:hypothetical protein